MESAEAHNKINRFGNEGMCVLYNTLKELEDQNLPISVVTVEVVDKLESEGFKIIRVDNNDQ